MEQNSTDKIGHLVKAKMTSLKRSESSLARRGLDDLRRLMSDPEVLEYVTVIKENKSWESRVEAWQKLRSLGPDRNGWELTLQFLLYDSDGWARIFAAESLSKYKCLPNEVVPVLAATLASSIELGQLDWATIASGAIWNYRDWASQFTPNVIGSLIEALEVQQTDIQGYCAATLGYCGTRARTALLPLAKICHKTEHQNLKVTALYALKQIDASIDNCLDGFVAALQDEDSSIRGQAVCEIAKFGKDATPKLSHILKLAVDPQFDIRRFLAFALGKIGDSNKEVIRVLESLLEDSEISVRLAASYAMIKLGFGANTYHKFICECLYASEEFIRFLAAWVLGEIGSFDPVFSIQALRTAEQSESSKQVEDEIRSALEKLRPNKWT